ncbi:MAG: FHA domain-containing protein [Thiotrichaceae bacterium]|nr:FHA domain-containing protein [Thiotrichaceae bacterium]
MAKVIIEVCRRGLQQFHPISNDRITIGRAFDNDIILSESTVSAHHLLIEGDLDAGLNITNLSNENITKLNKTVLPSDVKQAVSLPVDIIAGSLKLRVLSSETAVAPTQIQKSKGIFHQLSHPFWAISLLIFTLFVFIADEYLATPTDKSIWQYVVIKYTSYLYLLLFFLVIVGISRLASHRWDVFPALTTASLLFLIPELVDYAGETISYYFSDDTVSNIMKNIVSVLLLPILLTLFIIHVAHSKTLQAIGISLLVSTPLIAHHILNFIEEAAAPDFVHLPNYNKQLSHWDIRQQETISIVDFITEADKKLGDEVFQEIVGKNENENEN